MLVAAHRVETAIGGKLHLVHEVVVHQVRALRVEQRGMDVDPHRRVLVAEIVGQLGVRHQVEPEQLHGRPPVLFMRPAMRRAWPIIRLFGPAEKPSRAVIAGPSLRGAKRRSNPGSTLSPGLLRHYVPRNDAWARGATRRFALYLTYAAWSWPWWPPPQRSMW